MVAIPHSMNDIPDFILTWLPIVLFGIIAFLMWKTRSSCRGSSRLRSTRVELEPVAWSDIAGLDEAKEELREVVDFLRDRKRFERLGARVPQGDPASRTARHRQDAAGEGDRERVRRELLRVRARRRSWRCSPGWAPLASESCSPRRGRTRLRSSSSTSWMQPARCARAVAATTASTIRR